jgi:hypothetical protein
VRPGVEFDLRTTTQRKDDRVRLYGGAAVAVMFVALGILFLLFLFVGGPWSGTFPNPGLHNLPIAPVPFGFLAIGLYAAALTVNMWRRRPFRLVISSSGVTILDHSGGSLFTPFGAPSIDTMPWFRPTGPPGSGTWKLPGSGGAIWIPPAAVAIIQSKYPPPDPFHP